MFKQSDSWLFLSISLMINCEMAFVLTQEKLTHRGFILKPIEGT